MKTLTLHKKMILCAAAALLALPFRSAGAEDPKLDVLRSLQLNNSKIPIMNQGKLQMVIFSDRAERRGSMLVGFGTVLTIINKGADADAIRDDWKVDPYRLGASLPEVLDFWKNRIAYSDGIMRTAEAEIDSGGRRASGSRDVYFRSPMLDLDGVGFEADFDRRTISVNSQVRIVLRHQASSDPVQLLKTPGKLPPKYEYITASSDSMLIDSKRNEVMLIGNVRVDDEQAYLTCNRLTIFWKSGAENSGAPKAAGKNAPDAAGKKDGADIDSSGIDRILADGDVIITKRANPKERVFADHLIYDVPKGTAKLSGDEKFPRLESANGEVISGRDIYFENNSKRGHITGGCRIDSAPEKNDKGEMVVLKGLTSDNGYFDDGRNLAEFTGHVVMRNGDQNISCNRLRVTTAEKGGGRAAPAQKTPAAERKDTASLLGSPDMGIGAKEMKCADFYERVMMRDPSGSQLSCDRMHADFASGKEYSLKSADFHGHVEMLDASKSKLRCEDMHADFAVGKSGSSELSAVQWFRNVRAEVPGTPGNPPGRLTADRGELEVADNRVTFERNVRGFRDKATLKSNRLDIYLSPAQADSGAAAGNIAVGLGKDRIIRKIVATDKVRVTDESGTLDCDKLTLFFSALPKGAKPQPGMFQAGDARLTDILADGHVVAVNKASADSKKEPGILSGRSSGNRKIYADHIRADLIRNLSHLTGAVKVNDSENDLKCDEMFLYGIRKAAATAASSAPQDDPDADPFALPGFTEDSVPSVINVTDDVQLKKILCLGNVYFKRIDPDTKQVQEAGGGRSVYMTEKRYITLTDTPPRRPWLRAQGRQQYGSRIVIDLKDNIFKSYDTDTFTTGPGGF